MMHAKDILLPMLCHHKSKPEATAIEAIDYAVKVFARGLQDSKIAGMLWWYYYAVRWP